MPKVEFKRVETDAEVENIDIKDGQLIYSKSGKTYMDYGNERIPTGSGGEGGSTEVYIQDTEPTEEDWKIWVDSSEQADNTYYNDNGTATQFKATTYDTLPVGTEVDYDGNTVPTGWTEITDIQPGVYSTTETICGTWIDGKPLYRKVLIFPNGTGQTTLKTYTLSDYGITNVNEIFIVHPSFYTLSNRAYPFQYNDGTNAFECNIGITQLNVLLKYADIANSKFVITLEYTKTTD